MLKKLKSLFVIDEGASSGSAGRSSGKTSDPSTAADARQHADIPYGSAEEGAVEDRFLDILFNALEASNQEGFDYMEYKDFLRSLANVPMDDGTRFKSAFATAQTMGATKEKIISSASHYIAVLQKEQSKFQDALQGQKDRNLTGKQQDIKNLEETILNKEAEIEKLKADIEAHRQGIGTLEQEINAASEKLIQTANDFEATYQSLLGQIESDVKNIELHL